MKIVLAIDSFKGCLTSRDAESAASESIIETFSNCQIEKIPIADGGEGTLSTLMEYIQGSLHTISAHNPCMEIIPAAYGISHDNETAFIEMASISGITLIKEKQKNPMETTSYGTGELIRDALEKGCRQIILSIGGSATNDAGTGLLQALGYRFLDKEGKPLGTGGKILSKIEYIDDSQKHSSIDKANFTIACDVQNTFYGPNGAAHVYARQKGADDNMILALDEGMKSFAEIILKKTNKDISQLPGSGAAGGIGGTLAALLNAKLKSGADLLLEKTQFQERIKGANLIITGEGKIDRQTLMGKIPGKILRIGQASNIPVIAIAGKVEDTESLAKAGFKGIYAITPSSVPFKEAIKPHTAYQNIKNTLSNILPEIIKR